jgi:hypothetical protein
MALNLCEENGKMIDKLINQWVEWDLDGFPLISQTEPNWHDDPFFSSGISESISNVRT